MCNQDFNYHVSTGLHVVYNRRGRVIFLRVNIDILIKKDMNRFEGLYNILVLFLSVEGLHSFYNSTCSLSILSLYISIWICDIEDTIVMKTMKHFFLLLRIIELTSFFSYSISRRMKSL